MNDLKTLHAPQEIAKRVAALGKQISNDYAGKTVDIVCAINGGSAFCADLVRALSIPVRIHPLGFTSYPKASPSGEVRITLDVTEPLHGRDVLLVEGVVVSGRTPKYIVDVLRLRGANVTVCALGVKRQALAVDLPIGYSAFEFGAEIVVGYGVGEGSEKAMPYLAARAS